MLMQVVYVGTIVLLWIKRAGLNYDVPYFTADGSVVADVLSCTLDFCMFLYLLGSHPVMNSPTL
jgi:hypothetical protein